jgi:hypothetical protein
MKKCIHKTVSGSHRSKILDFMESLRGIILTDLLCGIIKRLALYSDVLTTFTPLLVGKLLNPARDNIWITETLCARR